MSFYSIAPLIKENYPEYCQWVSYPVSECVTIHKVKEKWGIFSNFAPTPIVVDGVEFKNAEQLFQILKFKDKEPVLAVYVANNPKMTAKHWEKECRREDWGKIIVDVMKFVLNKKYEQSKEFRDALEESKGYYIVEDQTSFPKKQPDTWGVKMKDGMFEGPNLLGRLLMELRDSGNLSYSLPDDGLYCLTILNETKG